MGFIYLNKFTYLNTFVIQLAQRCSDNGGPTVLCFIFIHVFISGATVFALKGLLTRMQHSLEDGHYE